MIPDGYQALNDLRAGMSDADFMEKYQLSEPEYRIMLNGCARKVRQALARSKGGSRSAIGRLNMRVRTSALRLSELVGSPFAFLSAILIVSAWALLGPFVHYGSVWLLVANTFANVVVFLMLFLLQNAQSRYSLAIQLKLNELVRAVHGARTDLVALEFLPEHKLHKLEEEFREISANLPLK